MYAQPSDVSTFGLNNVAMSTIPLAVQTACCIKASAVADDHLAGRYNLPISAPYPDALIMHVSYIAAKLMIEARGNDPGAGADETIELNYNRAIHWLEGVQRRTIHPNIIQTPTVAPQFTAPQVFSARPRGW
jgi:phage gp36-like protein